MSGMDMMLKSFGIDPEKIKNTVDNMAKGVIDMNDRLGRIEATQNTLLEILKNGQPKSGSEFGIGEAENDRTGSGGNEQRQLSKPGKPN